MSPLCFSSLSRLRGRGGGREGVGEVRGGMDGDNMKVMERDRGEGGMRHTHAHTELGRVEVGVMESMRGRGRLIWGELDGEGKREREVKG